METYDLQLSERHKMSDESSELSFKKIKKKIGYEIFTISDIYGDDENKFYIAKKIYNSIFGCESDTHYAFLGIDLKTELRRSAFELMNSVIEREYSEILKLKNEVESLKRERDMYKKICNIK